MDRVVTAALQSFASPALDLLANLDTLVGHGAVTAGVACAIALFLSRRRAVAPWVVPTCFALTVVVELALKLVIPHQGPPHAVSRSFWDLPTFRTPYSFPSGHVARVTFLALLASAIWSSRAACVAAVAIVVVTVWARVYIGDHWLSDALGGLVLGAALGWVALAVIGRSSDRVRPR